MGAAGRVDNTGGVSDLSQITRANLGPKAQGVPTGSAAGASTAVCQAPTTISAPPPTEGAAPVAAAAAPAANPTVVAPVAQPAPKRTSKTSPSRTSKSGAKGKGGESVSSLREAFNVF